MSMRIRVISREGHFNFLNPGEKSISTHISIYEKNQEIRYANFDTEYEFGEQETDNPEFLADEIEKYLKHKLYCSDEKQLKEMATFLRYYANALLFGNAEYKLTKLLQKKTKIEEEIEKTQYIIKSFKKEAVNNESKSMQSF